MERQVKEQLIKSVNSIKQKLKGMRDQEDETELRFQKVFKPITGPMKIISDVLNPANNSIYEKKQNTKSSNASDDEIFQDSIDNTVRDQPAEDTVDEICHDYKTPIKSESINIETDEIIPLWMFNEKIVDDSNVLNIPFGIRSASKQLMMGNEPVTFTEIGYGDNKINIAIIGDKKYEITPGIKELLLRKNPNYDIVAEKDMLVYKDILVNTHAHKRNFNPTGQIKGDRSRKYNIIKRLFSEGNQIRNDPNDNLKKYDGGKLGISLKRYKKNTDLVYWDDPNELIERLKLLIASRDAGNNNLDNEIISIIEELREAKIIKG